MTDTLSNILMYNELELYIKTFKPSKIDELGTLGWYEAHQRLQKVSQQAIFEVRNVQEETARNLLVSYDKVKVLVHEAVCVQIWREKLFPEILNHCPSNSSNTFMPYLVMFHEATAITILETILYHQDCCEALGDCVIDLIDYCAFQITKVVGYNEESEPKPGVQVSNKKELETHQKRLSFTIGIRCISLIRYIASNFENIPLTATTRVFTTHDFPIMLAAVRESSPWIRKDAAGRTLVFEGKLEDVISGQINSQVARVHLGDRWQPTHGEAAMKVTRVEAQLWLTLHQLLLDPRCSAHYDINEYRQTQLVKLQRYLHETVIDQLSPLIELKQWLSQLSISNLPPASKRPIILELLPEMRAKLLDRSNKKWKQLARKQADEMFQGDPQQMMVVAKGVCDTYDMDVLEALEPNTRRCSGCGDETTQRCSRCKTYYYCGRDCQVKNWKDHKPLCNKIVDSISQTGDQSQV